MAERKQASEQVSPEGHAMTCERKSTNLWMMAGFVLCSQFMPRAMSLTMHMRLEDMREEATSAHPP